SVAARAGVPRACGAPPSEPGLPTADETGDPGADPRARGHLWRQHGAARAPSSWLLPRRATARDHRVDLGRVAGRRVRPADRQPGLVRAMGAERSGAAAGARRPARTAGDGAGPGAVLRCQRALDPRLSR